MPRTVTLQATAKHPSRKEGEQYESTGGQALVDLSLRRAIAYRAPKEERETLHLSGKYQTKVSEPETEEKVEPKPKRRSYKRRDMTAE